MLDMLKGHSTPEIILGIFFLFIVTWLLIHSLYKALKYGSIRKPTADTIAETDSKESVKESHGNQDIPMISPFGGAGTVADIILGAGRKKEEQKGSEDDETKESAG